MPISVKMIELIVSQNALAALLNKEEITARKSLVISIALKKMEPEIKSYNEQKNKLIEKYGSRNDKDVLEIKPDDSANWRAFSAEMEPIDNTIVEVDVAPIDITFFDDLGKGLGGIIYALSWMIIEGKEPAAKPAPKPLEKPIEKAA